MPRRLLGVLTLALVALGACAPPLPDPDSEGAKLYRTRCGGCHRLYAPGLLTGEMWKVQLERMQLEMKRRGVRPLAEVEQDVVLRYLQTHGSDARPEGADS